MENELEKALKNKFYCPAKFVQEIEDLVQKNKDMSYIDAIIHFCDQNSIDVEFAILLTLFGLMPLFFKYIFRRFLRS